MIFYLSQRARSLRVFLRIFEKKILKKLTRCYRIIINQISKFALRISIKTYLTWFLTFCFSLFTFNLSLVTRHYSLPKVRLYYGGSLSFAPISFIPDRAV